MSLDRQLAECLRPLRGSRTVILGIGNTLKGDDAVGPLVCARLASHVSATVIDAGTVPENFLRPILDARPENLLIVDAIDFAGEPGQMRVLRADEMSAFAFSTHALSPHLFLDLLHQEIDVKVYAVGIQPSHTELGEPVAAPVRESTERLADVLIETFPLP
jgi:hydrogenase 3 maturation protease